MTTEMHTKEEFVEKAEIFDFVEITEPAQLDLPASQESVGAGDNAGGGGGCCMPRRVIITIACCLGMIVVSAMRVNLAITVVTIQGGDHLQPSFISLTGQTPQKQLRVGWSSPMIGFLHSIFYIGYLITHIPGGYVCTKVPGTTVFGLSILVSCLLNLLLPICLQNFGYATTCLIRLMQGLAEGFTSPAAYEIMRLWLPPKHVHLYSAWILGGLYAGPVIGFPLDGCVTHYFGWQYSYYIHGLSGVLWFMVWVCLAYETPDVDPCISSHELKYIQCNREPAVHHSRVPWKAILTSGPVWAVVLCHFVRSWMFFLMLTNQPSYLNQFHFNLVQNGIFAALPHVVKVFFVFSSGFLADFVMRSGQVSRTVTRKVFSGVGFGVEAACCFVLVFLDNGYAAVVFLTIGIGVSGLAVSGWQINHLDLAPDYASVLIGYSATVGTLGGILSPIIVGMMTHPPTLINWQHSFILTGCLLALAAFTYILIGSGDRQPWADVIELKEDLQDPADFKEPLPPQYCMSVVEEHKVPVVDNDSQPEESSNQRNE